jgi:hypothetical protein
MFQAVRNWWLSARGQRAARLFAFELTVVMIGVLAAQQISNWAQRRSALSQVEGLHRDLFHLFGQYRMIADTYVVAIPCLDQRVDLLSRLAAGDEAVDPVLLRYAPIPMMGPDEISPENYQLLRDRYGDQVTDKIGSVEYNLQETDKDGRELSRTWFEFNRMNADGGKVSSDDRAAARQAAVKIKGALSGLLESARTIQQLTDMLGVERSQNPGIRAVSSCTEMWRLGWGYHDIYRREPPLALPPPSH